jgi:predicted DNA-binding transcriptional regulator AlpA
MTRYLSVTEAAAYLTLSKPLLDRMRLTGGGPSWVRLGPKRVAYDIRDLDAWAAAGRREGRASERAPASLNTEAAWLDQQNGERRP